MTKLKRVLGLKDAVEQSTKGALKLLPFCCHLILKHNQSKVE